MLAKSCNDQVTANTLFNTVADQKKLFTPRQFHDADKAHDLYRMIGRSSEANFQRILRSNFIHNCPITPTDAARALAIYGKDIPFLKGTTTQKIAAPHVSTFTAVPLPPPVLQHHQNVTLLVCGFFLRAKNPVFLRPGVRGQQSDQHSQGTLTWCHCSDSHRQRQRR